MPTPKTPHLIGIKVYGVDNQVIDEATVTATLNSSVLTGTTNSSGEVTFNAADFTSWSVGDTVSITATKTGEGTKTDSLVLDSSPGQTLNITLAETSDYVIYSASDEILLNASMLTTYDGRKVTSSNIIY